MKIKDIRNLSAEDLTTQIHSEKQSLSRLTFAHATSAIENPMRIRVSRKHIARLQTVLTEKLKH